MKAALTDMDRRVDEFLGVCIQDGYMAGEGPVEEYRADLFRLLGFTREMADLCVVGAMNCEDDNNPAEGALFRALADRIEALLPPELLDD